MRIVRLDLLAYGPFTNRQLHFGEAPGGIALVYGPNEAGKSAALRAICAWLFGIQARTVDNFLHEYGRLLVGGVLADASGKTLEFRRRKAIKNSLLNPGADDAPYDDRVLSSFLHGIDRDRFEQVYGLGHAQLEAGGQQLQHFNGLAGESLFAASLGITGLNRVLEALDSEANRLFLQDRRSKSEIRAALRERDEANKARRTAECSASRWETMGRELRRARESHASLVAELEQLRARQARLERSLSVLGELGRRRALEQALADDAHISVLPAEYDSEARRRAEHTLDRATRQIETKQGQLDGADGLRAQLERLPVAADVLSQAEAIESLQTDLGAYRGWCQDLPKRQASRDGCREAASRTAAELGLTLDSAGRHWLTPEREALINALLERHQSLQSELESNRKRRDVLAQRLDRARRDLAELPADRATDGLRSAIEAARQQGDLGRQLAEEQRRARQLARDVSAKHAALGYWQGEPEQTETLEIPLRSTLEQYAARFKEIDDTESRLDQRERECLDGMGSAKTQIDRMQRVQKVPTEEALLGARVRRDRGWALVRAAWIEGATDDAAVAEYCGGDQLAVAYEAAVGAADEIADRLRREAETVAALQQLQQSVAEREQEVQQLGEARQASAVQRAELRSEWLRLWRALDVSEPGSPREMLEWLDRFADLRAAAVEQRRARERVSDVQAAIARHTKSIAELLKQLEEQVPAPDESLDSLLARSAQVVDTVAEQRRARSTHQKRVRELEDDLAICTTELCNGEEALSNWRADWTEAVSALGATGRLSTAEARARVAQLRELGSQLVETEKLDGRIQSIEAEIARFERDVSSLLRRCAPDLAGQPPAQAVGELSARLRRATENQARRKEVERQIEQLETELLSLRAEQAEAVAQLGVLCKLAGVDSPGLLTEAERNSERKRVSQSKLRDLDDRLLSIGRGASVQTLIDEAREKDGDSIQAELAGLGERIQVLERQRDEAAGRIRDCEKEYLAVDGNATAAEADERSLAVLGRIRDHADRFVRLRLAAVLLRQRIEQHRAKTQDPMLERASELFRRMTCGSFSRLTVAYDEKDQPVIQGRRASTGQSVPVEGFSDGTADQLYLALRLAYLERHSEAGEPMPLIVDDILVDFDEQRAAAALRVLAEVSQTRQVIFFTHHEHIRQIVRQVVPKQLLVEAELPPVPEVANS